MLDFDKENEYLSIKTVAEYFFCERAAFYMLANWENDLENEFIFKGTQDHQSVGKTPYKHRLTGKIYHHHKVISKKHRIYGICDAVEFTKAGNIMPIEYKTGKTRENFMHTAQLHLQTICLEEMFNKKINFGYLYFAESKERIKILMNAKDRKIIIDKLYEFRNKLNNRKVEEFKICGSPFCSYSTVDDPLVYA